MSGYVKSMCKLRVLLALGLPALVVTYIGPASGGMARAGDRPPPMWAVPPVMIGENTKVSLYPLRFQHFEEGLRVGLYPSEGEARVGSPRRAWVRTKENKGGLRLDRTSISMTPRGKGVVGFRVVKMRWRWEPGPDGQRGDERVEPLHRRLLAAAY